MVLYTHEKPNGEIFYVGIGKPARPFSFIRKGWGCRSKAWWNVVDKHGMPIVKIIEENLTVEEAKQKEIALIKAIGRRDLGLGTLVNHTDGGDGVSNWGSLEQRERRKRNISASIKEWHNVRSAEEKSNSAKNRIEKMSSSQISEINSRSMQTFWNSATEEEKKDRIRKLHGHESMKTELRSIRTARSRSEMTPEQHRIAAEKREASMSKEDKMHRSEKLKSHFASLTPEEKKARSKKAWETRRKNKSR